MAGMAAGGTSETNRDPVLRFLHDTLGLEHLHYGLWIEEEPEELSLATLREAQERYAQRLIDIIGGLPVQDVLDVGCGFGKTALALASEGYHVSVLSPDPQQLARLANGNLAARHNVRFEDYEPRERHDLVLMSESSQYVASLQRLFAVAAAALHPGGYLLIADYFVRNPPTARRHPIERSGHHLDSLRRAARDQGFLLELDEDITRQVLPTLELGARLLDRYVTRTLDELDEDFRAKCGATRPLRRFLRRQLKYRPLRLAIRFVRRRLASHYRPRIDPEAFRELKEYRILLYRRSSREDLAKERERPPPSS